MQQSIVSKNARVMLERPLCVIPLCTMPKPKKSVAKLPSVVMTFGSFNTKNENLHGRMAMCGLTAAAIVEQITGLSITQQIEGFTGQSISTIGDLFCKL